MNKPLTMTIVGLSCCSLLLAWMIPLHMLPWGSAYNDASAFLALLLLCPLILKKPIQVPSIVWLVGAVAVIPVLQWTLGIVYFFGDALIVFCYVMGLALAILVGHNLAYDEATKRRLYTLLSIMLIVVTVASTWIAIRQWLLLQDGDNYLESYFVTFGKRPNGNLGQPNNLATLLCMGIASVFYLFERRLIGVVASSFLTVFLIFGVALTRSATPWIDAIFLLIWCIWKGKFIKQRLTWPAIAGWMGIYLFFIVSLPFFSNILDFGQFNLVRHDNDSARLALWHQFGLAIIHGPLWGYGWNQVSITQIAVSNYFPVPILTDSSHNILLDLLIWNGPILGGVIIIFAVVWLYRLIQGARSLESTFSLLAISFVLIHSMLELPLLYAYFLLPVGFMLGAVNGEQRLLVQREPYSQFVLPPAVFATFFSVGTLFLIRIVLELSRIHPHNVYLDKVLQTRYIPKTTLVANKTLFLTQLADEERMDVTQPAPGMTAQQLEWMREISYRYPSPAHLCIYATALAVNNQPKLAIQQLEYVKILFGEEAFNFTAQEVIALQQQLYATQGNHPELPKQK